MGSLIAVLKLVLTLVVAPALVGASTLAARRWGRRLGGLVSAFPAIAFAVLLIAVLLIDAHQRGAGSAARAASSTLLGLLTLSVFVVALHGAPALQDRLRGMVSGMAAFVVFCALVAVLVQPAGIVLAFGAAVIGAVAAEGAAAWSTARRIPLAT